MNREEMNKILYKGYIPLKDKKPFGRPDNTKRSSIEEVKRDFPTADVGGLLSDNVLYLDFDCHSSKDDKPQKHKEEQANIKKALNIIRHENLDCIVRESKSGIHALFLDTKGKVSTCKTNTFLASGLTADVIIGRGHKKWETIECQNEERKILYQGEKIGEIPPFFMPIKEEVSFIGMKEGEGRNQALFNHILTLTRNGLDKGESRKTCKVINACVFDEPLKDSELEEILRDDAFPKDCFYEKNKFKHDRFGDYLIKELNIKKVNDGIYIYNGRFYSPEHAKDIVKRKMIEHIRTLPSSQRMETWEYIKLWCEPLNIEPDTNYICFKNGLYNFKTGCFESFTPDVFVTNGIPHNYNPKAESEYMNKAFDEWCNHDEDIRRLLEESIGITLSCTTKWQKMFILYGKPKSGKTTFLKVLEKVLGENNYSSLQMEDMGERFNKACLLSKLANIGDDLSDNPINNSTIATIKNVVTGGSLTVEYKGENPFSFHPYATLFFSANVFPTFNDPEGAMGRRIVPIPFDSTFKKDVKEKENLFSETDLEYFIRVGVEGLRRLESNNGECSIQGRVAEVKDELLTHISHVKGFVNEYQIENILRNPKREVYQIYLRYCRNNEINSLPEKAFTRAMCSAYTLKSEPRKMPNGDSVRMFVKADYSKEKAQKRK